MQLEERQFYSNVRFYNQSQNTLDFCLKNAPNKNASNKSFFGVISMYLSRTARHTNFQKLHATQK